MKKIILGAVAWSGIAIIALGLPWAFSSSEVEVRTRQLGSSIGLGVAWVLGVLGTSLMLAVGFKVRPRYLWIGSIVIGIVYISSSYGIIPWWVKIGKIVEGFGFFALPGIACIIGGILMWRQCRRIPQQSK